MEYLSPSNPLVLVVDDDKGLLASIRATLSSAGLPEPALQSDSRMAMECIRKYQYPLIILDLLMPRPDGMELLPQIKAEYPTIEVVILTAVDDVATAVQAMQYGAYDYLLKPISTEKLLIVVQRALERHYLQKGLALFERAPSFSELKHPQAFASMVAADESMARVFHQVENVAPTDYNVVITGETGTGKEMLARIIHSFSQRGSFLAVNMAAFSKELFESEFFGHTRGAFTGAGSAKKGFLEAAEGGTLFLDEITELNLDMQAKLLRVIQEKELYRLGSTQARRVDIRFIAASNRDIRHEVQKGAFRSDLYYRLNTCNILLPPLRERIKDILPLAYHFLRKHAGKNRKEILSLAPALEGRLLNYAFPGNVRELENIIAAAVFMEAGTILTLKAASHLLPLTETALHPAETSLSLAAMERKHILQVLETTGDNRTQAARLLGIGLRTLQRKLKEYDV